MSREDAIYKTLTTKASEKTMKRVKPARRAIEALHQNSYEVALAAQTWSRQLNKSWKEANKKLLERVATASAALDAEKKAFLSLKSAYTNMCEKHGEIPDDVITAGTSLEARGQAATNQGLADDSPGIFPAQRYFFCLVCLPQNPGGFLQHPWHHDDYDLLRILRQALGGPTVRFSCSGACKEGIAYGGFLEGAFKGVFPEWGG